MYMPLVGQVPSLVQTRPSFEFDPPCESHQLLVILEYSEPILGTQPVAVFTRWQVLLVMLCFFM